MMDKSTLALSHMTLTTRLFKHEVKSSITGNTFAVASDDEDHKFAVQHGLLYWVLREEISDEEAMTLSEWRNSDNNQNLMNSEAQLLRAISRICRLEVHSHNLEVRMVGAIGPAPIHI